MTVPIFIPPPIRRTKKCDRCGQLYPKKVDHCIHCHDLSDSELDDLKFRISQEHEANRNLGKLLMFIAVLILLGMVIYSL